MIVPMKKAAIAVLAEDREALLQALQKRGCLMPLKTTEDAAGEDSADADALVVRAEKSLLLLQRYDRDRKRPELPRVKDAELLGAGAVERLQSVERTEEELQTLRAAAQTLAAEIAQLEPWRELPLPPAGFGHNGAVVYRAGTAPRVKLDSVRSAAEAAGAALETFGLLGDGFACVLATPFAEDAETFDAVRNAGFTETALPPSPLLIAETIARKTADKTETENRIETLSFELAVDDDARRALALLREGSAAAGERLKTPVVRTPSTVFLEGWVRADRIDDLKAALAEATPYHDLSLSDPEPEDTPPTEVKNNRFVTAFETITDMFAKPAYGEIDPNPVLSFWYWMLFGMMMADFGYGIVMIVLFAFLIRRMKAKGDTLKLLKVLMYSGITTALWGILFNSYFGASIPWMARFQILVPMEEALSFLVLSLIVGVGHIFTGLIMKAANNIRRRDWIAVFADSLSWILFIAGIGMLFLPGFAAVGKWLAIAGAAIVVLFAGRSNKNPVARIGAGLYALYGATGFLGDIMSYARILALALSSAVIAYVMNLLAGMIQGSVIGFILSLVVYLVGHLFNLVMGLLSAYVHTSRLQFIEFFTKFYDGSGHAFQPLSFHAKYVERENERT